MRNRKARKWMVAALMAAASRFSPGQTTEPTTEPTTLASSEPTTSPTTMPTSEPSTMPTSQPTTIPTTSPTTGPTTTPSTLPATEPTTAPVAAETAPLTGIVEGTFFAEREGRIQLDKDKRHIEFIFEQDGKETGVPILPNLELMRLENAVEQDGWQARFRVSGWVTEYQAKNYILLDHASRVREKSEDGGSREVR